MDTLPSDLLASLGQALVALAAVCALLWLAARWSGRGGYPRTTRHLRVLERVPVGGRQSICLVAVGDRVLLIGTGESGAPTILADLDPDTLPPEPAMPAVRPWSALLERVRGR